jgi:hypothetical protein
MGVGIVRTGLILLKILIPCLDAKKSFKKKSENKKLL